jgi:hypothetical protein
MSGQCSTTELHPEPQYSNTKGAFSHQMNIDGMQDSADNVLFCTLWFTNEEIELVALI